MNSADTIRLTKFKKWLLNIKPDMEEAVADVTLPGKAESWFNLLGAASEQQNLTALLKKLSVSQATIARLFAKTMYLLPDNEPDMLQELFIIQNQVMAAMDKLQPSSFSPQQEVEAITKLSQKFRKITQSNQLKQDAVRIISEIFNYPCLNLILVKGNNQGFSISNSLWKNQEPSVDDQAAFAAHISNTQNIIKRVIETAQAQENHQPAYTTPHQMKDIVDELGIPIVMRGQVIGVLHVFSYTANQLGAEDLYILEAIANQLVIAMENIQLQSIVRQRVREQKIMLESNAVLGSSMDVEDILNLLALKITEALRAGACVISQWYENDRTLVPIARHLRSHQNNPRKIWRTIGQAVPIQEDPIARQVLKTMRPIAMQAKQAARSDGALPQWAKHGWRSIFAFPLQTQMEAQSKKLGLIEVYDVKPNRVFNLDDIQLGKALANQANIIIERVELFQQTQQRLLEVSTLFSLSNQITSTLNLDDLLNNIVTIIRQIADCRACVLFLLDDTEKHLEIRAASGLKTRWQKTAKLAVGEGAAGQAVAERRTISISDTTKDPSYIFFDQAVRSLIVVPMVFQDKVIGAINLDDTRPNAFHQSQERLLGIAANQAAIAIKNAMLFNQVHAEERQTGAIIQYMADGILMLNGKGEIVKVNPALGMMLGMHPAELIGKNIHSDNLPPRLAAICAPTTEKERTGVLAQEVTLPGTPPAILRVFATPVADDNNQSVGEIRVAHDVTQERELERMKDDFVATISHELRTPLFSIQGFARLILDGDVPDIETQQEFLSIIERQATQLTELVNNLLDLRKLADGFLPIEKQPVQLIDIVNQTVLKLQGFAYKEHVKLTSDLPTELPEIMGDPQRLEQVLTNLVGNAIKFTSEDGFVTINAKLNQRTIIISVKDTGVGIAEKNLERIFNRFFQVGSMNQSAQGSGLGLHISKQLIEKHNGKIWAESSEGKGSTFFIQLPVANI